MKTKLMGILNVTPDSFYDNGRWADLGSAIQRGLEMIKQGTDILDVGGESTRPGATPVNEQEEMDRVLPIISALANTIPISIDTMKVRVAEAAIVAGASLVNDMGGCNDPFMRQLIAESKVKVCVGHMLGEPRSMQINPFYPNGIIEFLLEWFKTQIDLLEKSGVSEEQIILDPGIGFGKTVDDNIKIVQNMHKIKALGFPVLVGFSRKSFLGKILHKPASELLTATVVANTLAVRSKVDIIRVHDIIEHRDLIDLLANINE